jgi:hypothetical protein
MIAILSVILSWVLVTGDLSNRAKRVPKNTRNLIFTIIRILGVIGLIYCYNHVAFI